KFLGEQVHKLRMVVSDYELGIYHRVGQVLSHALEATCRTVQPKQTEQEIAGHLAHRVMKHGPEVISAEVTADDRLRLHRRPGFTAAAVTKHCVITATARLHG